MRVETQAQGNIIIIYAAHTFSPAELLLLPSASLAERDPMPIDGKTAMSYNN